MSENKKNRVSLSSLTGKNSNASTSSPFPSFRFSPENDELEEVLLQQGEGSTASEAQTSKSSTATSTPSSGGDTSPIKEYIMRHKWANKWDKRSLSLDLDLKGKIITAIEDKRKSIVSHFIPEENSSRSSSPMPQSHSIPDHIGSSMTTTISSSSIASEGCQGNYISTPTSTIQSKDKSASSNSLHGEFSSLPVTGEDDEFEEIGTDPLNTPLIDLNSDNYLDTLKFIVKAEELDGAFHGPLSASASSYIPLGAPSEQIMPEGSKSSASNTTGVTKAAGTIDPNPSLTPSLLYYNTMEDLSFSHLLYTMLWDVLTHPGTKYWAVFFAMNLVLPWGSVVSSIVWFLLGAFAMGLVFFSLVDVRSRESQQQQEEEKAASLKRMEESMKDASDRSPLRSFDEEMENTPKYGDLRVPTVCQAWITTIDGEYDPITCNIRNQRVVLMRLDGTNLFISYPHTKTRIPKRRLWSDPISSSDYVFTRHSVYSVCGATISIAPEKLAKRRTWNKKYPICIKFPDNAVVAKVSPTESIEELLLSSETGPTANNAANTSVNYNVNTAGVSVNKSTSASVNPAAQNTDTILKAKKDVSREDFSFKTIYVFARTDREKDIWFRRLSAASKIGVMKPDLKKQQDADTLFNVYKDYMLRAVPVAENLHFKEPEQPAESSASSSPKAGPKDKERNSGSSSKKSSPDKEKKEKDLFPELQEVLMVPQAPAFLNAFLGRVFFDFLRSPFWTGEIQRLIEKKLHFLRKPQFLETIHVKELDLGSSIPKIERASAPILDSDGLWIFLDIDYEGKLSVTLETYVNLMKLRRTNPASDQDDASASVASTKTGPSNPSHGTGTGNSTANEFRSAQHHTGANMFDSDADDSGESSEEEFDPEDIVPTNTEDNRNNGGTNSTNDNYETKGQKIMRMAEKFASSKVMQSGVIQKVVGNIGSTPIMLCVELSSCIGTLAVNIPPPPTDRMWVGFKPTPSIQLVAKPRLGERVVNLSHVTDWIKKKILLEFQRAMVMPNMDDISIPLMEFKFPE